MRRREAVAAVAAAFAPAGCLRNPTDASGPRMPPTSPPGGAEPTAPASDLYVSAFDVEAGESGDLRVVGTVTNRGDVRRTGTVEATVSVDGESRTRSTRVTVAAGGETRFEIPFDVAYESFESGGDVRVGVR